MSQIQSYRDLLVWKLAMKLTKEIHSITKKFPADERYGLTSQLRRAAVSIPSNIAEGHARSWTKVFLNALSIAIGSLAEVETQLTLANDFDYITETTHDRFMANTAELGKYLHNLIKALERKLK